MSGAMVRFKHRYLVATIAASPEKVAELGPKEISVVLKVSISRCWLLVCGCLERNVLVSRREGTCMVTTCCCSCGSLFLALWELSVSGYTLKKAKQPKTI